MKESNLEKLISYLRKENLTAFIDAGGKYPRLVIEGTKEAPGEDEIKEKLLDVLFAEHYGLVGS